MLELRAYRTHTEKNVELHTPAALPTEIYDVLVKLSGCINA